MPFTPFHLGPGALLKAVGGDWFSLMIFAGSQLLMDVEPLVRMIRGDAVLHGPSHTVAGAFVIAIASTAVGRPVCNVVLEASGLDGRRIGWMVAVISALVGTYSHIGLDAVMHTDMVPFWPVLGGNALLEMVSSRTLHILCVVSGLLGGGYIALRALRNA